MPSVVGMGLKEAVYLLERNGLLVSVSGVGRVEWQSVRPGTPARRGMPVSIRLGCSPMKETPKPKKESEPKAAQEASEHPSDAKETSERAPGGNAPSTESRRP